MEPVKPDKKRKIDIMTILLITALFISSLINGYMYFQIQEYGEMKNDYAILYDRAMLLENYYNNLTNMYSELRIEYSQLSDINRVLIQEYANLTEEYQDVINFNKEVLLVRDQSVSIRFKSNVSYTYELPFSGYIVMNFTANDDVYVWIGGSMVKDVYYSRYPQFPETASTASFLVPVVPDLHVFIGNPNEFNDVRVKFSIKFIY